MTTEEIYGLGWPGKRAAFLEAWKGSNGSLDAREGDGVNSSNTGNIFVDGDNLEVLRIFQDSYLGKVKMIYIDPPYNTGKQFIYKDKFFEKKGSYEDKSGETMLCGRFHSKWLSMIFPRLILSRNLLRRDGVIFISIDENEQANLKLLCNEVFGEKNFVANIAWDRSTSPKNDSKFFSFGIDYILVYAKDRKYCKIGRMPRTNNILAKYRNIDDDIRGVWCPGNLTAKTYSEKYDYAIETPDGRFVKPCQGSCWRVSKKRFQELLDDNRIWFGKNGLTNPYMKRFLSEVRPGMVPTNLWSYKDVGSNQEARRELRDLFDGKIYFAGSKPLRLLKRIVRLANFKDGDIGLDFFAGSGSTAHAIMGVSAEDGINRKFIMVQIPELCDEKWDAVKDGYSSIAEIAKERIRRAGKKILSSVCSKYWSRDVGFKVLRFKNGG